MAFYESLERFRWATPAVALLSPVADNQRHAALAAFCAQFYADDQERVFWLGINPSRVRNTSTGVPYTDGYALENYCDISNEFNKSRELTADFFYQFVERYGGAKAFYSRNFAGAAYPLSILRKEKYCNYYDKGLPHEVSQSIPLMIQQQAEIGHRGVLVIIGSGSNARVLRKINDEFNIFSHILVVEHPRYIMQYKSAHIDTYIDKFCQIAREAESLGGL